MLSHKPSLYSYTPFLSIEKRAAIVSRLRSGHSTRSIAELEQLSQSAVANIKKRIESMVDFKDKPRSGRAGSSMREMSDESLER